MDNVIVWLGGFYWVKNFFGVIGKCMIELGVEDFWIESDLCGSNVVMKIISGMYYNRVIRVYKLIFEVLERL